MDYLACLMYMMTWLYMGLVTQQADAGSRKKLREVSVAKQTKRNQAKQIEA